MLSSFRPVAPWTPSKEDRDKIVLNLKSNMKNPLEALILSYGPVQRARLTNAILYMDDDKEIFTIFYFAFRHCPSLKPGKRNLKNIQKAAHHLVMGNEVQMARSSSQLHDSIRNYNKCLCRLAEEDDPHHLWCYAYLNRGISLALLNLPDDAILDCFRILYHPTIRAPDNILLQVHFLLSCCYFMIEKENEGQQYWAHAKAMAQKLHSMSEKQVEATFKIHFANIYSQNNMIYCVGSTPLKTPELTGGPNEELPNASMKVELRYNETFGRHLVAAEDIKRGDVLIVEDPVVFTVLPKKKHKYCSFCLKQSHRLHPCKSCSKVMFCSPRCEEAAHQKFHSDECKILQYASSMDFIDINNLLIRLLCTYGFEQVKSFVNSEEMRQLSRVQRTTGFTGNKFEHDKIAAIYTLCAPSKMYHMSRFKEVCCAAYTAMCMKDALRNPWSKLGGFILHCYHVVATNNFGITSQNRNHNAGTTIGSGIYPTASLVNHKCDDNVGISFHATKLIMRAIQNIPKGEQVFTNYGLSINSAIQKKQNDMIHFVSMHNFTCDCYFCENITSIDKLPNAVNCNSALKLTCKKLLPLINQVEYPEFAFTPKQLKLVHQYLDLLEKSGQKFTKDYFFFTEEIRRHYRLKGNIFTCS